jgi:hypothetical protein
MFIVIDHDIKNATTFQQRAEKAFPLPDGLHVHMFLPASDLSRATCLYEADSVEKVRNFVEGSSAIPPRTPMCPSPPIMRWGFPAPGSVSPQSTALFSEEGEGAACPEFHQRPALETVMKDDVQLDYDTITERQQATWATGDFHEISRQIIPVSEAVCQAADPRANERVLDIACGSGNTALIAARRYCEVAGIDYVPTLIDGPDNAPPWMV